VYRQKVCVTASKFHPSFVCMVFNVSFHRFFETEGIAILTMLVSQYKISIKEEPQFAHETFEERKARVLAVRAGLTIT